jgi:hypothetical protein
LLLRRIKIPAQCASLIGTLPMLVSATKATENSILHFPLHGLNLLPQVSHYFERK